MNRLSLWTHWLRIRALAVEWGALAVVGIALVVFAAIVLRQSHYIPIWDSWIYANCVLDAATHPFEFERYRCAGHFSHAYMFLLAIPQWLGTGEVPGILCLNALLGMGAILACYAAARSVFTGARYRMDCALLAAVFAIHPVFLASAVFVNVDYGVLIFALITLACLLRRRTCASGVFGLALVFSKEVGVLVYVILLGCYLVFVGGRRPGAPGHKLVRVLRLLPLALPPVASVIYVCWLRPRAVPLWGNLSPLLILDQLTTVRLMALETRAALAGIFVLSFSWIPTAFIAADLIARIASWSLRKPARFPEEVHRENLSFFLWTAALATFFLTRFQTSVSVRYYAVLYPLLLTAFLAALVRLWLRPALRRILLGSVMALFLASAFRTLDPISMRTYGSFPFGKHEMLAMTSINHECCGHGLDQLVYNLEFVRIHEAIDEVLSQIRPSVARPIVIADSADWFLMVRMNPTTFRRTLRRSGSQRVPHLDITELTALAQPPAEISFLALATADNRTALARLRAHYDVTETVMFGRDGYSLQVQRMRRRE
jgi:hypothetical protein